MGVQIGAIPHEVFGVLIGASAGVGIWRGGREGTTLGLVLLAQLTLGWSLNGVPKPIWYSPAVDLVTLAICLFFVLTGHRYWTIWAAASPLLCFVTQILRLTVETTTWAYLSAQRAWTLVFIAAVIVGSLLSSRPGRRVAKAIGGSAGGGPPPPARADV